MSVRPTVARRLAAMTAPLRRWLASLSFRTGVAVLLTCIPFYILSFAQLALSLPKTTHAVLWGVLFGLAKTCQYGGLTILGAEGVRRLRLWWQARRHTNRA